MTELEDYFTIFIRLPFARADFVDPPPVAWSAAKERELWELLSKSSKGHEIDWRSLSERFHVTQAFLLQQAAWLYERQLSQVRAQMRKMGTRSPNTASPAPQLNTASVVGAQPMRRTGSEGSRVPSRLSAQVPAAETSAPGTPMKSRSSFPNRTASQGGASRSKQEPTSTRTLSHRISKDNVISSRPHSRRGSVQHQIPRSPKQANLDEPLSSSEEDMTQSRMLHRRPNPAALRRSTTTKRSLHTPQPSAPQLQLDEEDEEDSPAFLPFTDTSVEAARPVPVVPRDPSATIRGGITQTTGRPATHRRSTSERIIPVQAKSIRDHEREPLRSSASPTSELQRELPVPRMRTTDSRPSGSNNLPTPLSSQQQAALATAANLSPRIRRAGNGGHGSDTSPSMGSSFSDLDDASVTQSALEEALLSGMGNTTMTVGGGGIVGAAGAVGGVANRVSGISQALRSRYFEARGEGTS